MKIVTNYLQDGTFPVYNSCSRLVVYAMTDDMEWKQINTANSRLILAPAIEITNQNRTELRKSIFNILKNGPDLEYSTIAVRHFESIPYDKGRVFSFIGYIAKSNFQIGVTNGEIILPSSCDSEEELEKLIMIENILDM